MALLWRGVFIGSSRIVRTPLPGMMSPDPVRAWRIRACASCPGVAGVQADSAGEGVRGVERGHPDRVREELRVGVQDLLARMDLTQRQPGLDGTVFGQGGIEGLFGGASAGGDRVEVRVRDQCFRRPRGRSPRDRQGRVRAGDGPLVAGAGRCHSLVGFGLAGFGTDRAGSSSVTV